MTVTEILKGKKAYQKEYMLDEKDLDTAVVDRLANDAAQVVRKQAIRHLNVSQEALVKFVSHKKNKKLEFALGVAVRKLTLENKLQLLKDEIYTDIYFNQDIADDFFDGFLKSNLKDELLSVISKAFLEQKSYEMAKYLSKYLDLSKNKKVFQKLTESYPEMLIKYRDENGLSKKQIDTIFTGYIENRSHWLNLRTEIGWVYIEDEMTKSQLDLTLEKFYDFDNDTIRALLHNKYFNTTHALRLLEAGNNSPKQIKYLIEKLRLNSKLEKRIEELVTHTTYSFGREGNWNYEYFEIWVNNPTHNKEPILRLLQQKDKSGSVSVASMVGMVKSGKYNSTEIESLIKDDEYSEISAYMELVKEPMFSQPKLRELWKKYYIGSWAEGEIEGPNYRGAFDSWDMSFEQSRLHEFVYNMIKLSPLAAEFSMEYATIHNDDKYLPDEAKEMFLF